MKGMKMLANVFFGYQLKAGQAARLNLIKLSRHILVALFSRQLPKRNFSPLFAAIFPIVLKAYSVTAPSLPPVSCPSSIAWCPD